MNYFDNPNIKEVETKVGPDGIIHYINGKQITGKCLETHYLIVEKENELCKLYIKFWDEFDQFCKDFKEVPVNLKKLKKEK